MRGRFSIRNLRPGLGPAVVCYGLAVVIPVVWSACLTTPVIISPATTISPGTSSVSVNPTDFLNGVVCGDQPGMMQSYVATVTDVVHACSLDSDCRSGTCVGVTTFAAGHCADTFTLPSSPPTSCSQTAFFEYIAVGTGVGDGYTAVIDGYTQPADQLVAVCSRPGKASACAVDGDCAVAFGCNGRCLVTSFEDENVPCLASCVPNAADGGPPDLVTFHKNLIAQNFCVSSSVKGYADCLTVPMEAGGPGVDPACLAQPTNGGPANCLNFDFAPLQTACGSADAVVFQGDSLPDGGLAQGALKACTCAYTPAEGNRQMLNLKGEPVAPTWTLTPSQACGRGEQCPMDGGTCPEETICQRDTLTGPGVCVPVSMSFVDVPLAPCGTFCPDSGTCGPPQPTAIQVIPNASLGPLTCEVDGGTGTVTSFSILPSAAAGLPAETMQPCASTTGYTYSQGIVVGKEYAFTIQAFEGGTAPTHSAHCFATPVAGITVTAQCDPLICIGDGGSSTCP